MNAELKGLVTGEACVSFTLAGQLYALPVRQVRDVLASPPLAPVPLAPDGIAGSLNLRGRIVTAVDLRRRLGLGAAEHGAAGGMAVVSEAGGELYALLVDRVHEVVSLPAGAIAPNPPTLAPCLAAFSTGVAACPEGLTVVLDVGRLLALAPAGGFAA